MTMCKEQMRSTTENYTLSNATVRYFPAPDVTVVAVREAVFLGIFNLSLKLI
jgi:hypothetical protein